MDVLFTFTAWAQWTEKSIHLPPRKGNKIGNPPTTKMEGLKWIDHHLFKPGTEPETMPFLINTTLNQLFFSNQDRKKKLQGFGFWKMFFVRLASWKTCGVYQWFSGYVLFRSPHQHQQISPLGGGNFYVHPLPGGNDPIWRAYFSDGWANNHQLVSPLFFFNARHLNVMGSLWKVLWRRPTGPLDESQDFLQVFPRDVGVSKNRHGMLL